MFIGRPLFERIIVLKQILRELGLAFFVISFVLKADLLLKNFGVEVKHEWWVYSAEKLVAYVHWMTCNGIDFLTRLLMFLLVHVTQYDWRRYLTANEQPIVGHSLTKIVCSIKRTLMVEDIRKIIHLSHVFTMITWFYNRALDVNRLLFFYLIYKY